MIIGLTGGSGSGKSCVGVYFREAGFEIVDFDVLARTVCEKGKPCLAELTREFGNEILAEDGTLVRRRLGEIVFHDAQKLSILNAITHKYILEEALARLEREKGKNFLLDAPLLFEAGLERYCDYTVYVQADFDKRLSRIMQRDAISEESAVSRLHSQPEEAYYTERCDFVLTNNADAATLKKQTIELIRRILN